MKKLKNALWIALALILAIVVIGTPAANYYAETLYDFRPRFLIEMILVPLLFILASMQGALFLFKKANVGSRHERNKRGLLILVVCVAVIMGSAIIAHLIGDVHPIIPRLFLPLVSVVAGVLLAVMLKGAE